MKAPRPLGLKRFKPNKYQVRQWAFGIIIILFLAVLMGME
jgi:hypothetical protein